MSGDRVAGSSVSAVILVSSPAAALGRGFALALAWSVLLRCLAIFVPCETVLLHAIFTVVAMADACVVRVLSEPTALTSRDGSMNVQDFPLNADDGTGQALIGAATAALARHRSDIPGTFLAELLGSAVPDDLQRYGPDELAAIAERSWSLFAERKAGAPKISFAPAPAMRTVAVLDIINDDMPFLLDSVVSELNQRGLDIRLLVHPVFAVERDSAGT